MKIELDITDSEYRFTQNLITQIIDATGITLDDIEIDNDNQTKVSWEILNIIRFGEKLYKAYEAKK